MHYATFASFTLVAAASASHSSYVFRQKAFDSISLPYSPSYLRIKDTAIFGNEPPAVFYANNTPTQQKCPQRPSLKAGMIPWVSPPYCMFATNASADEPICAFVPSTFANGRGIALLTTPTRVAEILSSEAFTEPQLPPDINDYTNPPFEERDLPGRGKGLIANKPLQSGDRLFASTPILMIDEAIDGLQKADKLKLSYHALRGLPEASQEKFWALAGHVDGADPFDDRVDTNSFGIELANAEFWVIFPEIARLNHDCRPNSAYFFDPDLLTQYVHTSSAGPVPAGTELTISYLDASLPRAARQRKLHANWGFACTCALCSLSPPLSRASDRRLARISELTRRLGDWRAGSAASVGMALALVDLVEAEGLRASLPDAYVRAALQCSALADAWGAVRWASRAVQVGLVEGGWRSAEVGWARQLAEAPETHWSWGVRVGGGGIEYVEGTEEEGEE